jgi:hypothetical protein
MDHSTVARDGQMHPQRRVLQDSPAKRQMAVRWLRCAELFEKKAYQLAQADTTARKCPRLGPSLKSAYYRPPKR